VYFTLLAVVFDEKSNKPVYRFAGVRLERRLFFSTFATEDRKEGMEAFVGKRDPEWRHR